MADKSDDGVIRPSSLPAISPAHLPARRSSATTELSPVHPAPEFGTWNAGGPADRPQLACGPALVLHSSSPTRRSAEEGAAPWSRPLSSQSVSILSPAGRS